MELFGILIRSKIADRIDVAFAPPKIRKNVLSHRLFVSARSQKYIENIRDLQHYQKTNVSCSAGVSDAPRHQKSSKREPTCLQHCSKSHQKNACENQCGQHLEKSSRMAPKMDQKGGKREPKGPKGDQKGASGSQ